LSRIDLVDARTGTILCAIKPLDKSANANGQRKRLTPAATDLSILPANGPCTLIADLIAEYSATGLPPAYLPTDQESST
jgi:putative transposase